jgi:hypothetical protein
MSEGSWVQMKFDPELLVNVRDLISVMRGEIATLNKDQWEDTKECCADVMEQFLEMRREAFRAFHADKEQQRAEG